MYDTMTFTHLSMYTQFFPNSMALKKSIFISYKPYANVWVT